MIVLIPLLLLAAGPALGPAIGRAMPGLVARARARLHLGAAGRHAGAGVVLGPETLDRIVRARRRARTSCGCAGRRSRGDASVNRTPCAGLPWLAPVPKTRRRLKWIVTGERGRFRSKRRASSSSATSSKTVRCASPEPTAPTPSRPPEIGRCVPALQTANLAAAFARTISTSSTLLVILIALLMDPRSSWPAERRCSAP